MPRGRKKLARPAQKERTTREWEKLVQEARDDARRRDEMKDRQIDDTVMELAKWKSYGDTLLRTLEYILMGFPTK
jgi:hypothetical protein